MDVNKDRASKGKAVEEIRKAPEKNMVLIQKYFVDDKLKASQQK